jgi:hypothetical protein
MTEIAEGANQERLESELSSELDEVNIRDLERQLNSNLASSLSGQDKDEEYQPSPETSRKRKQPHSEDLSLNIRSAGRRRIYSRKSSISNRQ